MSMYSKNIELSSEETLLMVKNTYNRTVLFGVSVTLSVFSMLSDVYPIVYWVCVLALLIFSMFSRVLGLVAPRGSWFFYFYNLYHLFLFFVLFFYVFKGVEELVFLLVISIISYNVALSVRWGQLQKKYNVSGDELLKKD